MISTLGEAELPQSDYCQGGLWLSVSIPFYPSLTVTERMVPTLKYKTPGFKHLCCKITVTEASYKDVY